MLKSFSLLGSPKEVDYMAWLENLEILADTHRITLALSHWEKSFDDIFGILHLN